MKKSLFFLAFACTAVITTAQGGYLPNSGFENWSTNTIYENPDLWGSGNMDQGGTFIGATPSTDAQHLTKSVQLTNGVINNGQDTAFAYVYLGALGDSGPESGIPYSSTVDQIKGYYKGTVGTNDTATVLVIKFFSGSMVSMDLGKIYTSQTNWTAFTFNISPVPQDSIFVAVLSTNPFVYPNHASTNTVIKFDNISLNHSSLGAGAALPNNSFETWVPVASMTPDNWTTINDLTAGMGFQMVVPSASAYSGLYAARLETMEIYSDTVPGMLIYGDLIIGQQPTPWPYDATPATLEGQYKYTPSGIDQATVSFQFFSMGNPIGGNQQALTSATNYTSFSIPTNLSGTPDSLVLAVFSGENPGSVLILDDIQFAGGDVSVNEITKAQFSAYPNPAADFIQISSLPEGNHHISIFDNSGKLVSMVECNGNRAQLDVRTLAAGFYTIQVNSGGNIATARIAVLK